jgi:hypothetical protein
MVVTVIYGADDNEIVGWSLRSIKRKVGIAKVVAISAIMAVMLISPLFTKLEPVTYTCTLVACASGLLFSGGRYHDL